MLIPLGLLPELSPLLLFLRVPRLIPLGQLPELSPLLLFLRVPRLSGSLLLLILRASAPPLWSLLFLMCVSRVRAPLLRASRDPYIMSVLLLAIHALLQVLCEHGLC